MVFSLNVHNFSKTEGGERLTSVNPYKLFTRKDAEGVPENFHAQGGKWYDLSGVEVPVEDIPEWVWAECRAMSSFDRGMYRILLPEEIAKGQRIPTFEEQEEFPTKSDIMKALLQLDPANDGHWTSEGLPNLQAVKLALGAYVSRSRLNSVAPNYVRPVT